MPEDQSKEKLREDVKKILEDIEQLNKDLGETGEETPKNTTTDSGLGAQ